MNISTPPPISDEMLTVARAMAASGATHEDFIEKMRALGLSQIPSIHLLRKLYGLSYREAKMAVHQSKTWADQEKSTETLHESAFNAAKDFGFEEVTVSEREHVSR